MSSCAASHSNSVQKICGPAGWLWSNCSNVAFSTCCCPAFAAIWWNAWWRLAASQNRAAYSTDSCRQCRWQFFRFAGTRCDDRRCCFRRNAVNWKSEPADCDNHFRPHSPASNGGCCPMVMVLSPLISIEAVRSPANWTVLMDWLVRWSATNRCDRGRNSVRCCWCASPSLLCICPSTWKLKGKRNFVSLTDPIPKMFS